jgi:hypothetical protein
MAALTIILVTQVVTLVLALAIGGDSMRKPLNTIMALRVEELRLSKRQLQADLRAMGLKQHSVTMAQLTAEAKKRMNWFAHDALRNILRMQLEDCLKKAPTVPHRQRR